MGLPIWREPTEVEAQKKHDPTARARSTIRRGREVGGRQNQALPVQLYRTDSSPTSAGSTIREAWSASSRASRPRRAGYGESATTNVRPRSRRGPTSAHEYNNDNVDPPTLRRMNHRNIADEIAPSQRRLPTQRAAHSQRPSPYVRGGSSPSVSEVVNGLGDRERSESPVSEIDTWAIMENTITPDPSLPSAATSFASGGGSFSNSQASEMRSREPNIDSQFLLPGLLSPLPESSENPASVLDNCDAPSHTGSESSEEEHRASANATEPFRREINEFQAELDRLLHAEPETALQLEETRSALAQMQDILTSLRSNSHFRPAHETRSRQLD